MDHSPNAKPPVLLVHGMWSNQDALQEVHDAFVEQGYVTVSLRLPYHCFKTEHTVASKEKLAHTGLQDYVAYIVEQVKRHRQSWSGIQWAGCWCSWWPRKCLVSA